MQYILIPLYFSATDGLLFLRCSDLSFLSQASITQDEKLAPGFCTFSFSKLASMSSISLCGKRIPLVADLLFIALVAIIIPLLCAHTPYMKNNDTKSVDVPQHLDLKCPNTKPCVRCENREAQQCGNTCRASNHNVIEIYAMTTMNSNTHSPASYYWLFLAVNRSDASARPHREAVTAPNERAARQILAGQFVLSFAGRLPVQEAKHA